MDNVELLPPLPQRFFCSCSGFHILEEETVVNIHHLENAFLTTSWTILWGIPNGKHWGRRLVWLQKSADPIEERVSIRVTSYLRTVFCDTQRCNSAIESIRLHNHTLRLVIYDFRLKILRNRSAIEMQYALDAI